MDICRSGQILQTDSYSFLSFGQRWINHEWLADVLLGFIYMHFGWVVLVLFKTVLVACMLLLVGRTLDLCDCDYFEKGFLVLFATFFASPATNCIRPHIFSCLFLSVLFLTLKSFKNGRSKKLSFYHRCLSSG